MRNCDICDIKFGCKRLPCSYCTSQCIVLWDQQHNMSQNRNKMDEVICLVLVVIQSYCMEALPFSAETRIDLPRTLPHGWWHCVHLWHFDLQKKGDGEKSRGDQRYHCHVCNTNCRDDEGFRRHMNSNRHKDRMLGVLSIHEEKSSQIASRMKAEKHLRHVEDEDKIRYGHICMQLFFPLTEVVVFCILIFDYMLEGFLMDQFVTFFTGMGNARLTSVLGRKSWIF